MTEIEKWEFINKLDDELLMGNVMLSEWSTFLAKDAELAFCSGANLASILTSQAVIESHLRYEYFDPKLSKGWGFKQLIDKSPISTEDKNDLHELRQFRNQWVHVNDPHEDYDLLEQPEYHERIVEEMAKKAITIMLKMLYLEQGT